MSAIIHEYELSIWKDVWAQPTLLDDDGSVYRDANGNSVLLDGEQVLDEEKSVILSTDNMNFGGKAINIVFKVKINGTHELTFDLPGKYIDPNTGKKVHNFLRDYIDNETKVKLHYRDKWYCFHVKKVTEKREKNYTLFSYTCEDSFITELSKTGYKLTFNEYTEHYIEQIHIFGDAILEGSEWRYDKEATDANCDLKEYQEEKLVEYVTTEDITVYPLVDTETISSYNDGKSRVLYEVNPEYEIINGQSVAVSTTIPKGSIVYGFYSEVNRTIIDTYGHGNSANVAGAEVKQIIYVPPVEGIEDGEQYEISGNTIINKNCNYLVLYGEDNSQIANAKWTEDENPTIPHFHRDGRYGLKLVYNQYTEYCKPLDRYVKRYYYGEYNASNLYSYTKTHVMVPEIATNYAANGKDMVDTTGWAPALATDKLSVERISNSEQLIGYYTDQNKINIPIVNTDKLTATPATYGIAASGFKSSSSGETIHGKIINTGPFSRKLVIDSPTVYALKINYKWINIENVDYFSSNSNQINTEGKNGNFTGNAIIHISQPIVTNLKDSYYKDIVTEASALNDAGDYNLNSLISFPAVSDQYYLINFDNKMLENGALKDLFIEIEFDTSVNQQNVFCIESLEFFEAWTFTGEHTQPANGWDNHIGTLTQKTVIDNTGESSLLANYYIVPRWRNNDLAYYLNEYKDWESKLTTWTPEDSSTFSFNSAAGIYSAMMTEYDKWKAKMAEEKAEKYTLVTSESIVTGETFDEEVFFQLPAYQPLFADPVVYYCNPEEWNVSIEQWYNNRKYRTLKQEKSNRFNLSQELSKLFKVYPVYDIKFYPNGVIKKHLYDENNNEITKDNYSGKRVKYSLRDKRLYYTENRGGENKYGFKYGHNLNSISRTIDSTDIVTKMFVADNASDYAVDGICSIARAIDNVGKDTYLLNFSYFIDRKKISREKVEKDVYSKIPKTTHTWSQTVGLIQEDPQNEFFKDLRVAEYTNTQIPNITVYQGFLPTIGGINSRYDYLANEQAKLEKYQLIILEASVQTYASALKSLREQLAKQKQLFSSYVKENTNKKAEEYYQSVERIASRIVLYEWQYEAAKFLYEIYADLYNQYECEMHYLLYWKKQIEDEFNTRYESLLKEGTWQDSKYLEDNSYYLDAEKVLVDSCGPKITYTISVVDLSVLQKYAFTDFGIGDTTYVEDYEFFEDNPNTSEKYYQEKTIVSAITYNLDNPSKNTISLQNYTTKFDDLFSRITASVQSLTFNENIYQRAGKFTTNGQIDNDTLQETLTQNNLTVVGNQDVTIDSNGVLVTDLRIPSNKVKITGTGVLVTSDGGNSWKSAIGDGGINADLLNIGAVNTQKITIFNENYSNFVWDKEGITAYGSAQKTTNNGVESVTTSNTYVRFNQYGLFFVKDNKTFEEGLVKELKNAASVLDENVTTYIMDNANVAITHNGFSINGGETGNVRLNSTDGLIMKSNKGIDVKVGYIDHISSVKPFWGLYAQGAYIEGSLYSDSIIERRIGTSQQLVNDTNRAIVTGGRFKVYRNIIEKNSDTLITSKLKSITTFGSTLLLSSSSNAEVEQSSDDNIDLDLIGSSIHIDKDGKFWSVAGYEEGEEGGKGYYKTRLIYSKEAVGPYSKDTFYVHCPMSTSQGTNTGSDRRLKTNIQDLDDRYIKLFDNLKVKKFQLLDDNSNKYHLGFIAQDVEQAIKDSDLEEDNLNLVTKYLKDYKGLSYTELLTLCVLKIKSLEEEIQKIKDSI